MESTQTFEFKPGLLAKRKTFHLFGDRLEYRPTGKPAEVIFFKEITASRFAVTTAREYRFRRLDLTRRNGEIFRVNVTTSLSATRRNDADLAEFYALVESFADTISTKRPDLTVTYAETQKILWVWFSIGVLSIAGAAGMLVLAIITRVPMQKLMGAILPMALMVVLGLVCISSNPFKKKPVLGWDVFGEVLREL